MKGWLSVKDLAKLLRFTVTAPTDPEHATREWLRRQKPPIVGVKRGRVILIDERDVDAALRKRTA